MKNTIKLRNKVFMGMLSMAVVLPMGMAGANAASSGPAGFLPSDDAFTVKAGVSKVLDFTANDTLGAGLGQDNDAIVLYANDQRVKVGETLTTDNATYTLNLVDGKVQIEASTKYKRGADVTDVLGASTQAQLDGVAQPLLNGTQTITVTIAGDQGAVGAMATGVNDRAELSTADGVTTVDILGNDSTSTDGSTWVADTFYLYNDVTTPSEKAKSITGDVGTVELTTVDGKLVSTFTGNGTAGTLSFSYAGNDSTGATVMADVTINVVDAPITVPETPVEVPVDVPAEVPVTTPEVPVADVPVDAPVTTPVVQDGPIAPVLSIDANGDAMVTDDSPQALAETAETGFNSNWMAGVLGFIVGVLTYLAGSSKKRRTNAVVTAEDNSKKADVEALEATNGFNAVTKPTKVADSQFD